MGYLEVSFLVAALSHTHEQVRSLTSVHNLLPSGDTDRALEVPVAVRDGLLALVVLSVAAGSAACGREPSSQAEPPAAFAVEEATIDSIHAAVQSGRTTCSAIVQAYIDRARAYNGVCTSLVTADGADIASATGYVRAGAPLTFPTRTTNASTIFPDLDQYRGKPLD